MNYTINRRKHFFSKNRRTFSLLLLGLPSIITMFILCYIPLYGIILPFKNFLPVKGVFASPWVGLENFKFILQSNQILQVTSNAVSMNLLFSIFSTIFGVVFALLLYEIGGKAVRTYQTIFFMPYYLSWAIVSFIVLGFLDDNGFVNKTLTNLSLNPVHFYSAPQYWPFLLVVIVIWKSAGYGALIYYASLMGIDSSNFEAASIDGATKFQQIRYISLPSILPMIIMLNLLALGRVFFGDIGLFYQVTLNSPLLYPTTDVIDTYVLRALKTYNNIGMASAAGLYQSVCGFILVMVSNLVARKINPDVALF